MEVPTHHEIVGLIDAFIKRHGMKPTRFGADATNDPNIVKNLRDGRSPSLATLHRLKDFMDRKDAALAAGDHADVDTVPSPAAATGKARDVTATVTS